MGIQSKSPPKTPTQRLLSLDYMLCEELKKSPDGKTFKGTLVFRSESHWDLFSDIPHPWHPTKRRSLWICTPEAQSYCTNNITLWEGDELISSDWLSEHKIVDVAIPIEMVDLYTWEDWKLFLNAYGNHHISA